MSGIARIRPSRRYMIQQAVLSVADREWPSVPGSGHSARMLKWLTHEGRSIPGWLEAAVCREFRALSERWAA